MVPMVPSWLLSASCISLAAAQASLQIQIAQTTPGLTSDFIDPSFAGFGIEPSNLFSFTGHEEPNDLTFNLLDNLANYTGAPPHLRLGGNTQDYAWYQGDFERWDWLDNPNPTGQGNPGVRSDAMIIGPKWWEVLNRFPRGTPVTYGLNMAYNQADYIERIVTVARGAVMNMTNLKLVSFEIGNEPDLYLENGFRPADYDVYSYAQEWLDRASAVYEQVLKPMGIPPNFFEPAATASTIGKTFGIAQMYAQSGINATANGTDMSYIASWNQHDYFHFLGVSTAPLTLAEFTQFSLTDAQFAAWEDEIEDAAETPYRYALREMQSVGPIGLEGITNTFGGALWTLNFFLYAASLNITSVQLHMTDNSNASAWQPVVRYNRQPFVRPVYYGYAAFDQIIGPSCQAQVSQLNFSENPLGYDGTLKAYGVYQAGQIATLIVINGQQANVSDTAKSSLTANFVLPSSLAGQELHLAYLNGPGADATADTIWNGISYEQSGNGEPTQVTDSDVQNGQTVTIGPGGSVSFEVRDTQAVVANIGRPVGTLEQNETACADRSQQAAPNAVEPSTPDPTEASGGAKAEGTKEAGASALSVSLLCVLATTFMTMTLL